MPDDKGRPLLGPTEKLFAPVPLGKRHCLTICVAGKMQMVTLPARGTVVVGRAHEAGIRVDARTVSRQHARLWVSPGLVTVADLGSQNGTRVNGERLAGERPLAYG